jgi:isoquinoline 1-oxidoreductase beta subunit
MKLQDYPQPGPPEALTRIIRKPGDSNPPFAHTRTVSRREFIRAGGVLVVGVSLFACSKEQPAEPVAAPPAVEAEPVDPWTPDVYVTIDADGTVHIVSHRCEMGQGIKASLPAVVADEMEADWDRVVVEQATGDPKFGNQGTGGSESVINFYPRMREAGATVRSMLEQAAAAQLGVAVSEVRAENHQVVHGASGKALDFSELVADAAQVPVPTVDQLTLKSPDRFRYIGKEVKIPDLADMTHGAAKYGADIRLPGMKFAAVARPPVVFGTVKSFNADAAMAVSGVEQVLELPAAKPPANYQALGGVAVIATNSWAALKARDLLEIEWEDGSNADYDSVAFREQLLESVRKPGESFRDHGDYDAAAAAAAQTLDAEYYAPHLGHMMMEPPAACASVTADGCEIWAPTQDPQALIPMAAGVTGLPPEKIRVNMTLAGSGFGRKFKGDYVDEAIRLSHMTGAPVTVQWSREDEVRHGYYHTVSAQKCSAALDADGKVTAWRHRAAYPSLMATFNPAAKGPSKLEMGQGLTNLPFAIENVRIESCEAPAKVRVGWLRSVCTIFQAFGINSFTDEIAHARGVDPLQNLLDLLGEDRTLDFSDLEWQPAEGHPFETGRLRGVIELAASKGGWGRDMPAGHGLGIAAQYSFNSYAASVVEVAVADDGSWSVPRVDVAIDVGQIVNADRARAQMEGASVFGLSLARYGKITAAAGRIQQGNFHDSRVVPYGMHPQVGVHTVESHAKPSGIGEPGVPPFAPALANAIFAATGKRIRELPIGNTI